ncbi:hypothetical protein [Paraburkholderia sp. J67]|uniref:hypothetical protein n=1 Tax=Paraburkholderia sp. J67 TaxID=2805435 RepID=UPI002ABE8B08|nr:hypothetical protein [Paraburkholderia sp. J67]
MDECMTRQVQQIQHMQLAAEVEQLCGVLFERWCARRCVVALGCLMRYWPIVSQSAQGLHNLSSSLEYLADFEQDALDFDERELILQIICITNHIV